MSSSKGTLHKVTLPKSIAASSPAHIKNSLATLKSRLEQAKKAKNEFDHVAWQLRRKAEEEKEAQKTRTEDEDEDEDGGINGEGGGMKGIRMKLTMGDGQVVDTDGNEGLKLATSKSNELSSLVTSLQSEIGKLNSQLEEATSQSNSRSGQQKNPSGSEEEDEFGYEGHGLPDGWSVNENNELINEEGLPIFDIFEEEEDDPSNKESQETHHRNGPKTKRNDAEREMVGESKSTRELLDQLEREEEEEKEKEQDEALSNSISSSSPQTSAITTTTTAMPSPSASNSDSPAGTDPSSSNTTDQVEKTLASTTNPRITKLISEEPLSPRTVHSTDSSPRPSSPTAGSILKNSTPTGSSSVTPVMSRSGSRTGTPSPSLSDKKVKFEVPEGKGAGEEGGTKESGKKKKQPIILGWTGEMALPAENENGEEKTVENEEKEGTRQSDESAKDTTTTSTRNEQSKESLRLLALFAEPSVSRDVATVETPLLSRDEIRELREGKEVELSQEIRNPGSSSQPRPKSILKPSRSLTPSTESENGTSSSSPKSRSQSSEQRGTSMKRIVLGDVMEKNRPKGPPAPPMAPGTGMKASKASRFGNRAKGKEVVRPQSPDSSIVRGSEPGLLPSFDQASTSTSSLPSTSSSVTASSSIVPLESKETRLKYENTTAPGKDKTEGYANGIVRDSVLERPRPSSSTRWFPSSDLGGDGEADRSSSNIGGPKGSGDEQKVLDEPNERSKLNHPPWQALLSHPKFMPVDSSDDEEDDDDDGEEEEEEEDDDSDEGSTFSYSDEEEAGDLDELLLQREMALEYHRKRGMLGAGPGTGPLGGYEEPAEGPGEFVPSDYRLAQPSQRTESDASHFRKGAIGSRAPQMIIPALVGDEVKNGPVELSADDGFSPEEREAIQDRLEEIALGKLLTEVTEERVADQAKEKRKVEPDLPPSSRPPKVRPTQPHQTQNGRELEGTSTNDENLSELETTDERERQQKTAKVSRFRAQRDS